MYLQAFAFLLATLSLVTHDPLTMDPSETTLLAPENFRACVTNTLGTTPKSKPTFSQEEYDVNDSPHNVLPLDRFCFS